MKKFILLMLIFTLSINTAYAYNLAISETTIDFGDVIWGDSVTETFTITNNEASTVNNIQLTTDANTQNYSISFSPSSFNLSAGASKTITVELELQKGNDKDEGGNKNAGNIIINDQSNTHTISMILTAVPRLYISNVDVKVGTNSESSINDGEKITKAAKPADNLEFVVEVENLFDKDDEEYDIESVSIKVTIIGIEDEDDIEAETEEFMISSGEKKSYTLTLKVPDVVIDGNYDILIETSGKNVENSNKYSQEFETSLDIEKRKDDIIITKYDLSPASLSCGKTQSSLHIELLNQGTSDEDAIVVEIKNSDINMNERLTSIRMATDYDKDARYSADIPLEIGKEFLKEGSFPLTINVYYDTDKLDDQKTINLEVKSCNSSAAPIQPVIEENITEENLTNQTEPEQIIEISGENFLTQIPNVVYESINSFRASYYAIPLLAIFILIGIVFLIKEIKKN